jgi:enoyl-CoA hydratase
MEIMGIRTGIRAGTELCSLGIHTESMQEFLGQIKDKGLTGALSERDEKYGDYRTTDS